MRRKLIFVGWFATFVLLWLVMGILTIPCAVIGGALLFAPMVLFMAWRSAVAVTEIDPEEEVRREIKRIFKRPITKEEIAAKGWTVDQILEFEKRSQWN